MIDPGNLRHLPSAHLSACTPAAALPRTSHAFPSPSQTAGPPSRLSGRPSSPLGGGAPVGGGGALRAPLSAHPGGFSPKVLPPSPLSAPCRAESPTGPPTLSPPPLHTRALGPGRRLPPPPTLLPRRASPLNLVQDQGCAARGLQDQAPPSRGVWSQCHQSTLNPAPAHNQPAPPSLPAVHGDAQALRPEAFGPAGFFSPTPNLEANPLTRRTLALSSRVWIWAPAPKWAPIIILNT